MRIWETNERLVAGVVLLLVLASCAPAGVEPEVEQSHHSQQQLTASELQTLGFESPSLWVSIWQPATLSQSSLHTEGQFSLALSNLGSTAIRNVTPIKSDGSPGPSVIGYDVRIPTQQVDPHWYGDTQLYLNAP